MVSTDDIFLTGGDNGVLKLWNFDGTELGSIPTPSTHAKISHIRTCNKVSLILVATTDYNIYLLDAKSNFSCVRTIIGLNESITDLCVVGPQKKILAMGTISEQVRFWHTEEMEYEILSGHEDSILCLAVSENWLASGSKDQTARVWCMDEMFRFRYSFTHKT